MALRVVGAGLGRTGTRSLQTALAKLLDAPCYHMVEVFGHPDHVRTWHAAANGDMPDWPAFLDGYAATVDWPAASFWPELSEAFSDAIVLLSVRDAKKWFESVESTIMTPLRAAFTEPMSGLEEWSAMIRDLWTNRFTASMDEDEWIRAFDEHNERVRASVAGYRLVEWQASDGWAPICDALGLPVPDEPFPWENKRETWGSA